MLASALRGNAGHRALDQFEQSLLHALTRYVTGDGGVIRLAGDFVDLVDVDDAALGALHVVLAALQQFLDDVFNVFAHITGFGQSGGVGHHKRHIEHAGHGLGQQCFA